MHDDLTQPETRFPIVRPIGVNGMLVTFGDRLTDAVNQAALAFRAAVEDLMLPEVSETTMSLASVFVGFDPLKTQHDRMADTLSGLLDQRDWYAAPLPDGRRHFRVPCVFGGALAPQFEEAAEAAGLSPAAALEDLTGTRVRVLTLGFAPGQPYLGTLPPAWDIPRQTQLTPRVPSGALIIAIRQLVLFTAPNSTGWRHIGQTKFRTFQMNGPEPFALSPGDELSFRSVSEAELAQIDDPLGGADVEVIQ